MNTNLTPERFKQAREHFHLLLELPSEVRQPRMKALQSEDPELACVVAELLDHASRLEEEPVPPPHVSRAARETSVGTVIGGRYRILEQIGEGGMAEVYLAERTDDIAQRVAVKLMRNGSPAMVERFVRERQILARLNHPHIAHLTDGGLTETGLPWFAMEYVDGDRITTWCDRQRLDLKARVRLFIRVCRAVQFAHRNLVMHRDLKPSNILVDGDGAPRLLDFGIAKLIDDTDPDKTQTMAMTPAYAAPEQLRGEPVSTACDIYQLGLVLHELLTGIAARHIRRDGRVRGRDGTFTLPRLDQTYARHAAGTGESIAGNRASQPGRLKRALRGDLDRIVRKACADDPRERYDTAQQLADDLDRWLHGLPVIAYRGSFTYRAGKLLRRHAVASGVVTVCAIGLIVATVYSYQQAKSERLERQRSEMVLNFMRSIFQHADPHARGTEELRPAELLERAAYDLDGRIALDDLTKGTLLTEISYVFNNLGLNSQALTYARRALDLLEPNAISHRREYLSGIDAIVRANEGLDLYQPQLEVINTALPLAAGFFDAGVDWHARLLRHRGYARTRLDDLTGGEQDLISAIALMERRGIGGQDLGAPLNDLGIVYSLRGRHREAAEYMQRALEALLQAEGVRDLLVYTARNNIAYQKRLAGEIASAIDDLNELLPQVESRFGAGHARVINTRLLLAQAYAGLDRHALARESMEMAESGMHAGYHANPRDSVISRLNLMKLAIRFEQYDRALALADELEGSEQRAGVRAVLGLHKGEVLLAMRDPVAATGYLMAALDSAQESQYHPGDSRVILAEIGDALGRALLMQGEYARAGQHLDQAIAHFIRIQGEGGVSVLRSRIHRLWVMAEETGDPGHLEALKPMREKLVAALNGEDGIKVRQFDALVDRLAARLEGTAGADAAPPPMTAPVIGLNSFD